MKRAIEEYFPIVEINRLAVPERNSFKPIYQMHKWFARRSSSVFRAILLGAMKPAGTDIMAEFYKDHTHDPDTNDKVILDPFMGGGTTVVEALRLGCKVIGIDLNPVAWFIVKTEVEPVDIDQLKAAFERLAQRKVEWSGKPLKQTLLELYKTECPGCGNEDADIIYTFWVKSAPCTTAQCDHYTPLFNDYIISQKKPSIRYLADSACPHCNNKFDWEREPAAMVAEPGLMVNAAQFSAGEGRTTSRWAFSNSDAVVCPWCAETVKAIPAKDKLARKKVNLTVLLCPHCEQVWQFRGPLPETVSCPSCRKEYQPLQGNLPDKGKFICRGSCNGNVDKIIAAIRTLPVDHLLPIRPYAIEGYCPVCAERKAKPPRPADLFSDNQDDALEEIVKNAGSMLWKNNGKFFKRMMPADVERYQSASRIWGKEKERLPYPKSEIPMGEKTKSGLLAHHYRYWHQMFNDRQLLALSTLLRGIEGEGDDTLKEMLLSSLFLVLESNNLFTRYRPDADKSEGVFARHDFQPKVTVAEGNVWGTEFGKNSLDKCFAKVIEGKEFCINPSDRKNINGNKNHITMNSYEKIIPLNNQVDLFCKSSTNIELEVKINYVITDPPYASNVNYSELADFFYVWIRLLLQNYYQYFTPEISPKTEEIIENKIRNKSSQDFQRGLQQVFIECHHVSDDSSLLVFTFHHAQDKAWEALIEAICNSGYFIEAVYPIHGEAESSLHLMNNEAISYDLIHVCRKRLQEAEIAKRSWAGIRHEIRRRAREEARMIESGRFGNEPLSPTDIAILLIGKCLELYSQHYGAVVDHEDKPVPVHRALEEIRMLVDQIVSRDKPLPAELENIDVPSYIYFTTLCRYKEIKSDEVSKATRGIIDVDELKKCGLIIKGREKRGRSMEVKQPIERLNDLKESFQSRAVAAQIDFFADKEEALLPSDILLVDCVHLLLGLAEAGENVLPWLERFRGLRPQIRSALEYLKERNKNFAAPIDRILGLVDERTLFTKK